jgi:hypothetical protein
VRMKIGSPQRAVPTAAQCARAHEPDQDIAQNATPQCGCKREYHDPEQVDRKRSGPDERDRLAHNFMVEC